MSFLYRHGLFVSHKQPYLDWANGLEDDGVALTDELSRGGRTVYLVPEVDGEPDLTALLDEFWEDIFEQELGSWIIDEDQWPKVRSREMFDDWFHVEMNTSVYDLTPGEPLTQREIDASDLAEALAHCAACGLDIEEEQGRLAEFALADRSRFAVFEGRVLPLSCDDDAVILAMMTIADSEPARAGVDLLVRVCSARCEKMVRKLVPKALRQLSRQSRGATP